MTRILSWDEARDLLTTGRDVDILGRMGRLFDSHEALREENERLKERVREMEAALDARLDVERGEGER